VQKGLANFGQGEASLMLSEKLSSDDRARSCAKIAFTGTVQSLASLFPGEAILRSADGRMRYEICFKEIFQQKRKELFDLAERLLFKEAAL
jgi:vacuolar-type H+-ATPase subunit E/Vma4